MWVYNLLGIWNVLPYNPVYTSISSTITSVLCSHLLFNGMFCEVLSMVDYGSNNGDRYAIAMANAPSGCGWRNFMHYSQLLDADGPIFKRYDYENPKQNMAHYGVDTAPDYDLSKITFPIAIMSGDRDTTATPKDISWTVKQLRNSVVFNH